MRRRAIVAALALSTLTACTPREVELWREWHAVDPVAAEAFAAELAETQPASRYGLAVWDGIARCESGGNWSHRPVTNRTGTYSGGLMIGHRWWTAYGGGQFSPQPWQATKAQQIVVAERIADDAGLDAGWQCYG